jgi:hypothetical protein
LGRKCIKWEGKSVLVYLKLIIVLSILMFLFAPTGLAKAVEPAVPYSPSSDNLHTTTDTRTDKYLLAHLTNFRVGTIANGNGNERNSTEVSLKRDVIKSKISSPAASSSIASLFEEYFGTTTLSNNDITPIDTTPNISPFSISILFETLSISTTYSNNNVIDIDLSHILGLDSRRIGIGVGGQLPSGLQIPIGALHDNSLNPISYFFTLTIRF